jgi:hypothetical protein
VLIEPPKYVARLIFDWWGHWVLTVGALIGGASGLSGGAPDRSCRLFGAPSARALTLVRTVAHLKRLQSTVGAK